MDRLVHAREVALLFQVQHALTNVLHVYDVWEDLGSVTPNARVEGRITGIARQVDLLNHCRHDTDHS
ncbi:MAG: hypothetical protein K8W52_05130 [Deltaproteobacteria bacterium]|nr:hypothetical protein [Deltaproteobacteria bacterium]